MMHNLHDMIKSESEEYQKGLNPIEDTFKKLASKMDDSAASYLLVESLCLLNKKIEAIQEEHKSLSKTDKYDVKLGGLSSSGGLVDPFAIQTEAAP